jgi:hypothetical protein
MPARARRRPAALDHPVSPVPGIGPAGLESSVSRPVYSLYTARAVSTASAPARQPISGHRDLRCPCHWHGACRLPRAARACPRGAPPSPRVHGGGFAHPAAADADAAASALRALRRGPAPWAPRPPGPSRTRMCSVSAATRHPRLAVWLRRPCRAHFSLCGFCRYSMATGPGAGPAVFPDTR